MEQDQFTVTVLEDGTIRTVVDGVSGVNHSSAETFMKDVDAKLGSKAEVTQRKKHHHHHEHTHEHSHKRN